MAQPTRVCVECRACISHRARQARRCEPCAQARRRRPPAPLQSRVCVDCESDISARHQAAKRCQPCAALAAKAAKTHHCANKLPRSRPCLHCGTVFAVRRSDTRFCQPRCRSTYHIRARRAAQVHLCAWCGQSFSPVRSDAAHCSQRCKRRSTYRAGSDKAKRRAAQWSRANPARRREIANVNKGKRRAAEAAGPGLAVADWRRLLRRYRGRCAYCGQRGDPIHMDHVVPLSRGGRHGIGNVLPACRPCNLAKGAQLVIEWRRGRPARTT